MEIERKYRLTPDQGAILIELALPEKSEKIVQGYLDSRKLKGWPVSPCGPGPNTPDQSAQQWFHIQDAISGLAESVGFDICLSPGQSDALARQLQDMEVRIRITTCATGEQQAWITFKSCGTLVRDEIETTIDLGLGRHLLSQCEHTIDKHRYTLVLSGTQLEATIDFYQGNLSGLIIAEIEFPSLEASDTGHLFGREVTEDRRYKNAELARMTPKERRGLIREATTTPSVKQRRPAPPRFCL